MKVAILGWGSLLWEEHPEFDRHHEQWLFDGPFLKLEFSRVSQSRDDALTLVLDYKNGQLCQVAYAFSKRESPREAICDLRCREGTSLENIGFYFSEGSQAHFREAKALKAIKMWAQERQIDAIVWTDLKCNFQEKSKCGKSFSPEAAVTHIQALDIKGKVKAAEYVWCAPKFVETPLRKVLQCKPWFR